MQYALLSGDYAAVRAFGTSGRDVLIRALADSEVETRRKAAGAFGEFRDTATVDALRNALKDNEYEVRHTAALALSRRGDASGDNFLIQALVAEMKAEKYASTPDSEMAGRKLAVMGDRGVDTLIACLGDQDRFVRAKAVDGLSLIGTERVTDALTEALLTDSDDHVRWCIARSIEHRDHAFVVGRAVSAITRDIDRFRSRTSDEERANTKAGCCCIKYLENTLRKSASYISIDDLRAICALEPAPWFVYVYDMGPKCGTTRIRETFDCQQIIQLARQELMRRGSEA